MRRNSIPVIHYKLVIPETHWLGIGGISPWAGWVWMREMGARDRPSRDYRILGIISGLRGGRLSSPKLFRRAVPRRPSSNCFLRIVSFGHRNQQYHWPFWTLTIQKLPVGYDQSAARIPTCWAHACSHQTAPPHSPSPHACNTMPCSPPWSPPLFIPLLPPYHPGRM